MWLISHVKRAYALNSVLHHMMQAAQIFVVLHRSHADTVDVILRKENILLLFRSGRGMVLIVTGLSPRKPGFGPKVIFVTFMEDGVVPSQGLLRLFRFSPVSITPAKHHDISSTTNAV
jgi:hypothetical protein